MSYFYKYLYLLKVKFGIREPIKVGTCLKHRFSSMKVKVEALTDTGFEVKMIQSVSNDGKVVYAVDRNWDYDPTELNQWETCGCPQREIHPEMDRGHVPDDSIFISPPR